MALRKCTYAGMALGGGVVRHVHRGEVPSLNGGKASVFSVAEVAMSLRMGRRVSPVVDIECGCPAVPIRPNSQYAPFLGLGSALSPFDFLDQTPLSNRGSR